MLKKGFVHIVPVLLVALLVTSGLVGLSVSSDNAQKKAVGKVLSDKDEQQKQAEEQAQETAKKAIEQAQESAKKASEVQQNKSSEDKSSPSTLSNSQNSTKVEVEKEKDKLKIKTKNEQTGFESETETENGKQKTKIKFGDIKVEYEREGDKIVTKFKDEHGEELDLEASEEAEILDQTEKELEDDEIKLATGSAELGFTQKGNKVRTNFPLSVNPQTGELIVSTPAGEKIVTILPEQAIDNMIRAGVITTVDTTNQPPTPPDATSSSQSITNTSIELTFQDNQPVYVISGVKAQKFLGLLPVNIKLKTIVSSSDGSLVAINESLFSRLLDLISF